MFVERVEDLSRSSAAYLRDGDVVLTMGAGNIGAVAHDLKSSSRRGLAGMSESRNEFSDRVLRGEPMSRHTSWHAGGPADLFFTPRDVMDLAAFVRQLPPEAPLTWIGLGSNLLVRDGGIRGAVVSTRNALQGLERVSETRIHVQAGVPCARLARQCLKWGLGPAEFLAGIPGTLGGALAMNAGAWGGETWARSPRSRCSTAAAGGTPARGPTTRSATAA